MNSCPFCNIENSIIILANGHATAIYDNHPVTPGHSLIIPKRHIALFFETTREEQIAMLDLLAKMRELLEAQIPPSLPFQKGGVNPTSSTSASTTALPPARPCRTYTSI